MQRDSCNPSCILIYGDHGVRFKSLLSVARAPRILHLLVGALAEQSAPQALYISDFSKIARRG
jgi:hypothetical protein